MKFLLILQSPFSILNVLASKAKYWHSNCGKVDTETEKKNQNRALY